MVDHQLCELCYKFHAEHLVNLGFDELIICQDCYVNRVLQGPIE